MFPQPPKEKPPTELLRWLTYPLALTDKLRTETGEARLVVLRQDCQPTSWWDKYCLSINEHCVIHRDILMFSRQSAYWFARTIIPASVHEKNEFFFKRLKRESLGDIVFNSEYIERSSLCYYSIYPENIEYHWLSPQLQKDTTQCLWARFSVFSINNQFSFYLVEILLPELITLSIKADLANGLSETSGAIIKRGI